MADRRKAEEKPQGSGNPNRINRLLSAFKYSFDCAVGPVSNPAQNTKPFSGTFCFHPKKNALNPSGYDDMGAYLFFHANLLEFRAVQRMAQRVNQIFKFYKKSSQR